MDVLDAFWGKGFLFDDDAPGFRVFLFNGMPCFPKRGIEGLDLCGGQFGDRDCAESRLDVSLALRDVVFACLVFDFRAIVLEPDVYPFG